MLSIVRVVAVRVELSPILRACHHSLVCHSGQMMIQLDTASAAMMV
jgi:hypothetical protein